MIGFSVEHSLLRSHQELTLYKQFFESRPWLSQTEDPRQRSLTSDIRSETGDEGDANADPLHLKGGLSASPRLIRCEFPRSRESG